MKKSEITKQKILCAAEDAFAQKGLYGARVDEIAELSGVNKRMIYAHFESKENLYIEVINRIYTRMAEAESSLIKKNNDNNEYIYIFDNEVIREGEYSGNTVTGISIEGISIDDIYLGNTYETIPRALDVGYSGSPLDGNVLSATYRYFSATGKQKDNCGFGWYLSDTSDSLGMCISTEEELTIISEYVGKYLTLGVTVTGGGSVSEATYTTPVLIKDLFTPSIVSEGINLEINNPADDAVYYAFAATYTANNASDICAIKLTEDAGTVNRLLPIATSFDGAYVFMTDENFVPAGVMKSVGSVPSVGTSGSESNAFYEKGGKIFFAKTPVEQATLLVLKPTKADSFKEAISLNNLAEKITPSGGSIADYIAFAIITDSDKEFSHNIENMGYYRAYAVLKSGEKKDFYFSIKLHELFASAELKNATENDFIDILDNYTDFDGETLKKLYTVYKATSNKETVGKFLEAENMDMSFLKTAVYLSAFLENDDYEDELATVLEEKGISAEAISLMALNSNFSETAAALPAPCKTVDFLDAIKEKAITLGIKNAVNYLEVKKYLDAVSGSSVSNSMAEDFLGLTFNTIADVQSAINNYSPINEGSDSGSGGRGGTSSPAMSATVPVSVTNDENTNENVSIAEFTDVNESHWAYKNILKLADRKVIVGYEDGSFMPEKNVTRAELVKIICVTFNLSGQGDVFNDVKRNDWFSPFVSAASHNGIIKGENGNFRPDDLVSREDAALMLWRAAKENNIKLTDGKTTISDLHNVAGYAREAVKALNGAGIINGMEDGSYSPKISLTRAQAATILVRMLAEG